MGSGDCSFISWPILYPVMAFGFTEKKKNPRQKNTNYMFVYKGIW